MKNLDLLDSWWIVPAVLVFTLLFCFCFMSCAHAQELTASWYSIQSLKQEGTFKYSKGVMANGKLFKDEGFTCASRLFPLKTKLLIINKLNGKRVEVCVTDRIGKRFAKKRIDLSMAAFQKICPLEKGICKVKVEIVKRKEAE